MLASSLDAVKRSMLQGFPDATKLWYCPHGISGSQLAEIKTQACAAVPLQSSLSGE